MSFFTKSIRAMTRDVLSPEIEMWCDVCDQVVVSVTDLSSGEFFSVFGCDLGRFEGMVRKIGEMKQVVFAVCKNCLDRNQKVHKRSCEDAGC